MDVKTMKFGWKRDLPDQRDKKFKMSVVNKIELPKVVSLRSKMPAVYNQEDLGCCTAEATAALLHYRELTDTNPRMIQPSVLFQYYNTRVLEGTVKEDSGASIRTAVKAAAQWGICEEKKWPFKPAKFKVKPPAACYTQAAKYKAKDYRSVDANDPNFGYLLKHLLFLGNPVLFGFSVYEGIDAEVTTNTGVINTPSLMDRCIGGHAVLLIGYDDDKGLYEIRNSWGSQWGDAGHGWLPQKAYVENRDLAADFWTIDAIV